MSEEKILLEGAISVKAALEGKRREIHEIRIDKRKPDRNRSYILSLAEKSNVPVRIVSEEEISRRT